MGDNASHTIQGTDTAATECQSAASPVDRRDLDGASWSSDHPVNMRLSIPLVFRRYYITIVAGPERRSRERRETERLKHPVCRLGNIVFLGYSGLIVLFALAALLAGASALLINQLFDIHLVLS